MSYADDIIFGDAKPPKCQDSSVAKGAFKPLAVSDIYVGMGLESIISPTMSELVDAVNAAAIERARLTNAHSIAITPEEGELIAEVVDLAEWLEGETIDGAYEESQISGRDAIRLAQIIHAAGYRKTEGTK